LCADRIKILLVEDDGDTAFALSMLLDVEGFEVIRACNVSEAYDDALAAPPNLVITDIEMPMLTGLDLIRLFKQDPLLADIPIIAMSALARNRLQLARANGAAAVYQKPLDYERLVAEIKDLVSRSAPQWQLSDPCQRRPA
jgi:DNA-binding response OmpR family regulator